MRFLVSGSIAYDLLLTHEGSFPAAIDPKKLDRLSVSFLAERMEKHHGGVAANIGWNLALLGSVPLLHSAVGFDGGEYLELLRGKGVDTGFVDRISSAITATAIIATDNAERQITFFHPGADPMGTIPDLSQEREDIAHAHVGPRNPMIMLKTADTCAKWKVPYLFDPGQLAAVFGKDEFRRAVKQSAGLIVNEYEWSLAETKLGWSMKDVIDACGLLVITLAEKGVAVHTKNESITVPPCKPEKVINPTGAGDAFRAGFLTGLGKKWSLTDAARLGAAIASFVVEQEGTLLEHLDLGDLRERALEAYREELPAI